MSAPTTFDLYVVYDPQDASSTATTLRFPSAHDRDARLAHMDQAQGQGGAAFQLVPNLRFRRFGPTQPLARPSVKVKEALDRLPRASVSDVFMDPRTGAWVPMGWRPGTPTQALSALTPSRPRAAAKRPTKRPTR